MWTASLGFRAFNSVARDPGIFYHSLKSCNEDKVTQTYGHSSPERCPRTFCSLSFDLLSCRFICLNHSRLQPVFSFPVQRLSFVSISWVFSYTWYSVRHYTFQGYVLFLLFPNFVPGRVWRWLVACIQVLIESVNAYRPGLLYSIWFFPLAKILIYMFLFYLLAYGKNKSARREQPVLVLSTRHASVSVDTESMMQSQKADCNALCIHAHSEVPKANDPVLQKCRLLHMLLFQRFFNLF